MRNETTQGTPGQPGVVAVVHCSGYDEAKVDEAVGKGMSLLGGSGAFARRSEKILLKANLLAGSAPDKAVTTHPSVFRAVARHFLELGAGEPVAGHQRGNSALG